MILSALFVLPSAAPAYHAALSAYRRGAAFLAAACALTPVAGAGCETSAECGADLNLFFVPLIVTSLSIDRQASASAVNPAAAVSADVPAAPPPGPIIIRPPPRTTAARAGAGRPARLIGITQQLVAGPLPAGGFVDLIIHDDVVQTDDTAPAHPAMTHPAMTHPAMADVPPLAPLPDDHRDNLGGSHGGDYGHDYEGGTVWQMDHQVMLPLHAVWPGGTLRQQVGMSLTCGACGRQGGIAQFSGTARFTLDYQEIAQGSIEDIALTSPGGAKARGALSFWAPQPTPHLVQDPEAALWIEIDGLPAELHGHFAAWLGADGRAHGLFAMVPTDIGAGIGAVAGQFNGAGCETPCGVEN